jgi:hypothetical protein
MKIMTNITNTQSDMERYLDGEDLRGLCRAHRLDGFELLPVDGNILSIIPPDLISGIHLSYYNCWVDYWNKNEAGVISEFGTKEEAARVYGGGRQAIIDMYRRQLDFADSLNAEYVVFHVSDVSIAETVSYKFNHSDEEVAEAALELINEILDGRRCSFRFLIENLWWPGLTMTRPEITRRLLDGIGYEKKGIMLDFGHLLHTNTALTSEEEGVDYINAVLDAQGELCDYIKGVHLHQSLSGGYVRQLLANPPELAGSYYDRLCAAYVHVLSIDTHRPFTAKGVSRLIDRIKPDYLTYEFITRSRAEHEEFLACQNKALGRV